jgi:hypothetical protein
MGFLLHVIENFGNIPNQSLSKFVGNVIENNKSSFLRTSCVMKFSTVGNSREKNFQPKNQYNLVATLSMLTYPTSSNQFWKHENQHICLNEIKNSKLCIDLRFVGWKYLPSKDSHFYCILGYRRYLDWLWLWENYRLTKQPNHLFG